MFYALCLQQSVGSVTFSVAAAFCFMLYFSVVMDGSASPPPPPVELQPWTAKPTLTAAEIDARFAQYKQRADEEDEEEEEETVPDLQRDDMLARRTRAFQNQPAGTTAFNRFLPTPGSRWCRRGEVAADAATLNKKKVKEEVTEERDPRCADDRRWLCLTTSLVMHASSFSSSLFYLFQFKTVVPQSRQQAAQSP